MYKKLWHYLYENKGWKNGQKPLFSRFWDKEAFTKIFRKFIFSSAKDTPSCTKKYRERLDCFISKRQSENDLELQLYLETQTSKLLLYRN